MSIADWFSQRESRRYTRAGGRLGEGQVGDSDGTWSRCDQCQRALDTAELAENLKVCRFCGAHLAVTAPERIAMLTDEDTFSETDAGLTSCDPLEFVGAKAYTDSLSSARERSDLPEAVVTGRASIGGVPVALGVMDFRFIGASMGSVVGEKIARTFERATREGTPVVLVTASGGARMQEGMLSLMQMAKTSAAARKHAEAGLAYVAVLTNPTYGGVTASFATLADVIIAEPGAVIGFAGPRVIEQTIRQKLPKGFQTAEYLLEHGMIDEVVRRSELAGHLGLLLRYLTPSADEDAAAPGTVAATPGGDV